MRRIAFLFLFIFSAIHFAGADGRATINTSRSNSRTNSTISRSQSISRSATNRTTSNKTKSVRSATQNRNISGRNQNKNITSIFPKNIISRSAISSINSVATQTFNSNYDDCHDAYFTCMDQFCAIQNDDYRRCICSSRLTEIQEKQRALSNANDSLIGFKDLNLDVITKSSDEVKAMMSATIGEQIASTIKDKSESAKTLSGISAVLSNKKSLSTSGTLDIAGNINAIWSTTDLINGANIANLTGEKLYNAVHSQCSELVSNICPNSATLNMVASAYGMYIENDCSLLANALDKKKTIANTEIRTTNKEMQDARLENYNSHNSSSINDCIASVRQDITASTACGTDYVHCLDITGTYLNYDTGEPIYTPQFYQLSNQISLSGDILTNKYNRGIIAELNRKKFFASTSLDKCSDLKENVWDEFMRQAVIEIYQHQQEKIKLVKTECLDIVNTCYDEQRQSLKDFSNIQDETLLGMSLETVEDLCKNKLDTCSNLYGNGSDGMPELLNALHNVTDQRIASECQKLLKDYANNICSVNNTDTSHSYPYACRTIYPGEQMYASVPDCNNATNCPSNEYIGSLYQKFAQYALQMCMRPSEYEKNNSKLPENIIQDINIVMSELRTSMSNELSSECEKMGGIWYSDPYDETNTNASLLQKFYTNTGSNKKWGYCSDPDGSYIITLVNDSSEGTYKRITARYGDTMPTVAIPTKEGTLLNIADNDTELRNYLQVDENTDEIQFFKAFRGYYTGPDGTGIQYYDESGHPLRTWDIKMNTTLYAYWPRCKMIVEHDDSCSSNSGCRIASSDLVRIYSVYGVGYYADNKCTQPINSISIPDHIRASNFNGFSAISSSNWTPTVTVIDKNGNINNQTETSTYFAPDRDVDKLTPIFEQN